MAHSETLTYLLLASHCLFIVDQMFVKGTRAYALDGFLLGTVKQYSAGYDPFADEMPVKTSVGEVIAVDHTTLRGPDTVRYLWNSGRVDMTGISESMENLAQSLTIWVRSTGGGVPGQDGIFNRRVPGEVLHYATCVQFAWVWLALPVGLTVFTPLSLVSTVRATNRAQLPVWKSSPLTMLFHGPGGRYWMDGRLVDTHAAKEPDSEYTSTERGMGKFAERISVKLGDNAGQGDFGLRQVRSVSK